MIVVTGAAGFIGSCLITRLNQSGINDVVAVDSFTPHKNQLAHKKISHRIDRSLFFEKIKPLLPEISFIFHLGAKTNTLGHSTSVFEKWNTGYSKSIWELCARYKIPLVYASSAATYGDGELGFSDDEKLLPRLKPLNAYAVSKNKFDLWALKQKVAPPYWAGLKFFNVFGPNEYHKGPMASMVYQTFRQIQKKGKVRLFKSYRPDYADGDQLRDFIYVLDVIDICIKLMQHLKPHGIVNVGAGRSISFNTMVETLFRELSLPPQIEYIEIPREVRAKYQYYTQADISKLSTLPDVETSIRPYEGGAKEYLRNYLVPGRYYCPNYL